MKEKISKIILTFVFLATLGYFFNINISNTKAETEEVSPWCHNFTINLKYGDRGSEIQALQTALEKQGFYIGSKEKSDSYFGIYTFWAVKKFQEKYKEDILAPWGLKQGTGYVGITTRAKLNELYGCKIDKVFGQRNLKQTVPNEVVGNRVFHPGGVVIDRNTSPNRLYIWDSGNSRILAFSSLGVCSGGTNYVQSCTNNLDCSGGICVIDGYKEADLVIGQPDKFSAECNGDNTTYMPASGSTLCSQPYPRAISLTESPEPSQMAVDSDSNLYVFDKWNHRVLKYNNPFATDAIADFVWGQDDFISRECNKGQIYSPTRSSLCSNNEVTGVHISGHNKGAGVDVDPAGNIWAADVSNNRVLRFPANSKEANLVIGQMNFTSRDEDACNTNPPDNYLCRPKSIRYNYHSNQLYVIDWPDPVMYFRILIYNSPFTNGMSPDEVIVGTFEGESGLKLYRPTGIEVDPFASDSFWINDEDNSRTLYFQKQEGNWVPIKVLSQPDLDKTGFGGFPCDDYSYPHYSCEAKAGGGIGIDSEGNIYLTDLQRQFVHRFTAPIPEASELDGRRYPAENTILMSQFEDSGVLALPANYISEYGLSSPDSALLADYNGGQRQLLVANHYRILFWNDYDSIPSGSGADGVLFQDDFHSQIGFGTGLFRGLEKDSQGRIWMTKGDKVYVFNGPVHNGQSPDFEIPPEIPLRFGGNIISGELVGLAYDEENDALWVSDTESHRVIRIHHPLDDLRREVDMVLGQPDLETTGANRGMDTDNWPTCPNMVADGFGSLRLLRLDNYGNLYIIDASHEGWQCSNNRLLEYDVEDLVPHPSKNFFEQGERVPKRVYGGSDFTQKDVYPGPDSPFTPISVSFSKKNKMLMTVDAYGNPYLKRVFWYDNPIPECVQSCRVEHTLILPIEGSQLSDSSWDNDGNLAILDHTWNRVILTLLPQQGKKCWTDGDCFFGGAETNLFCELDIGTCQAPGVCTEKPKACITIYDPVCGCDGKTYSNDCARKIAGVSKRYDGECEANRITSQLKNIESQLASISHVVSQLIERLKELIKK